MHSVTVERALERIEDYEQKGLTTAEAVKRVAAESLNTGNH